MTSRAPARFGALACAVALLAACAGARPPAPPAGSAPGGWTQRAFLVRDHGRLLVSIPPGWTVKEDGEGEASAPAIRIAGPGDAFAALLTPLWNPGEPDSPHAGADTAQLFADVARRRALGGSVERELPLEELSGPGVTGFWFAATDRELVRREPGPDEFRHVVQGAAAVGPVILAFTLLDNAPGPHRSQLLELVRGARHVADGEPEGAFELEPVPDARTVPLRVGWPGKGWAVLVDLPGFRVGARKGGDAGAMLVLAIHPESGIVASVALRPAGEVKDAAGCRERAMAAIAASVPSLAGVRLGAGAAAARAAYTVASAHSPSPLRGEGRGEGGTEPAIPEAHAHAFLHRDGVCANVHVSKAAPGPEDGRRLEAILATVRLSEDL